MPLDAVTFLAVAAWALPALGCLALGLLGLFSTRAGERGVARIVQTTQGLAFLAALALLVAFIAGGARPVPVVLGRWFGTHDYTFELSLLVDWLSVSTTLLSAAIIALVARFSVNYLHREPNHFRFFWLVTLFAVGMNTITLAGNVDLLFGGWELVGASSALLISFFRERHQPVAHGLRAFITYRICDFGILAGAVLLHHYAHHADWVGALGAVRWPLGASHLGAGPATIVALLFLLGAMGKSAQFPVSGWLPRAMEGPTPSSALFYGALSVHAGVILLLRVYPLLQEAPIARVAVGVVGLVTAITAAGAGRVQSDVKNTLAYATLAQVGLMFVEIAVGLPRVAMLHLVANAVLRAWQMLRAPSALAETVEERAALRGRVPRPVESYLPAALERRAWAAALSRFHVDEIVERGVADPAMAFARTLSRIDATMNRWLWPAGSSDAARRIDPHDDSSPLQQPDAANAAVERKVNR